MRPALLLALAVYGPGFDGSFRAEGKRMQSIQQRDDKELSLGDDKQLASGTATAQSGPSEFVKVRTITRDGAKVLVRRACGIEVDVMEEVEHMVRPYSFKEALLDMYALPKWPIAHLYPTLKSMFNKIAVDQNHYLEARQLYQEYEGSAFGDEKVMAGLEAMQGPHGMEAVKRANLTTQIAEESGEYTKEQLHEIREKAKQVYFASVDASDDDIAFMNRRKENIDCLYKIVHDRKRELEADCELVERAITTLVDQATEAQEHTRNMKTAENRSELFGQIKSKYWKLAIRKMPRIDNPQQIKSVDVPNGTPVKVTGKFQAMDDPAKVFYQIQPAKENAPTKKSPSRSGSRSSLPTWGNGYVRMEYVKFPNETIASQAEALQTITPMPAITATLQAMAGFSIEVNAVRRWLDKN